MNWSRLLFPCTPKGLAIALKILAYLLEGDSALGQLLHRVFLPQDILGRQLPRATTFRRRVRITMQDA